MFDAFSPGDHPSDSPRSAFKPVAGCMRLFKKDAPAPDPAIGEAANRQIALAERQWDEYTRAGGDRDWMRGIADRALGISEANAAKSSQLTDYQLESMRRNDERYWNTAVPYENQLLEDVKRFDSQEYKDSLVNNAVADVGTMADNTQSQMQRGLTRMGVNAGSGAMLSLANQNSIAKASAMANAANKTRMAADQIGLSTKMQMYGGMKGLAGLGATNAGLATNAMGAGQSAASGMTGAGASSIGANNSTFGGVMNGMGTGISGWNQYSSNQINAANVNAQNDPFNTILGAATGVGMKWALGSDRRLKKDITLVGFDPRTSLNLYEFEYIDGDGTRYVGVMADEVLERHPDAVSARHDGYLAVDYDMLGMKMLVVEGVAA